MIAIPTGFAAGIRAREGDAGTEWLAAIPSIVSDLCSRWDLRIDGQVRHGHLALVVPALRDREPCALKISWLNAETVHEAEALRIWNGLGTVRLLEASPDKGAMLLERLDARRTLFDLPLDAAVPVAMEIVGNLAIPGSDAFPNDAKLAANIAHTLPDRWARFGRLAIPRRHIDRAIELATALSICSSSTLVNWDLHHGNVLFSPARQKWVAIDPKPVIGCPESGIAPLFWTRISDFTGPTHLRHHLDTLIEEAGLDDDLTRAWMHVRVVDFWLWELSVGLVDDPGGCATILEWLAS